jgi:hypothetical protein
MCKYENKCVENAKILHLSKILDTFFETGDIFEHHAHWIIGSNNVETNNKDPQRAYNVFECLRAIKKSMILTTYEVVWLIENDLMDNIIKSAPSSKYIDRYIKNGYVLDCRWILKQYIYMINSEM